MATKNNKPKQIINDIHEALDSYNITVNSRLNETKSLPEWIGTLENQNVDLMEVTKSLRGKEEAKKAWKTILSQNKIGRFMLKCLPALRYGIISTIGAGLALLIIKWLDPSLATMFH